MCAQTSQEGIKCTKAKKQLGAYCPDIYTVIQGIIEIAYHEARESENRSSGGILPIYSPFFLLMTNFFVLKFVVSL